jgi:Domain of Unknown Function (DUF1206)
MGVEAAKAKRAAKSDWAQRLARAGLVAKGITFGLVAVLALGVVFGFGFGFGQKIEDRPGALQTLAESTLGRFLLGALAVGLAGYALWRLAQAVLGEKLESGKEVGILKRIGLVARGLLYLWLSVMCISIVFNADEPVSGGGGREEDRATGILLEQPFGRWLVAAIGLGIIGAGLFNLYRALTQRFRKELKEGEMEQEEREAYTVLGVLGHLARALVYSLAGLFLVKAAWEYDPDEAIGLDGALKKLAGAEYGELLLGVTAAGLLAYGLYCLVEARYREV